MPERLLTVLASTRTARRGLLVALALVAVSWVTTTVAEQRGVAAANAIEVSLPIRPQAIVYSRARLQITGPGVTLSRLDASDAAFAYRYSAATPPGGPPNGRGHHEFPWLGRLWRPAVHRLTNTLVPLKI